MINNGNENIKVKNFELGTILTMTTGYSFVDGFSKVFELVWFVCDDNMINTLGLGVVKDDVRNHILTLYPELKKIKYKKGKGRSIYKFLSKQEEKFGSILPVTKLGVKIPEEYRIKNSSYISSKDSEVIANKLDGFNYDQSKKSEVLSKYNGMNENNESVKVLKRINNK